MRKKRRAQKGGGGLRVSALAVVPADRQRQRAYNKEEPHSFGALPHGARPQKMGNHVDHIGVEQQHPNDGEPAKGVEARMAGARGGGPAERWLGARLRRQHISPFPRSRFYAAASGDIPCSPVAIGTSCSQGNVGQNELPAL